MNRINNDLTPCIETLRFRHHVKSAIRALFDADHFLEIDTPYLLEANTPDPFIDPFFAHGRDDERSLQLHTSPEIWLKKALGLGLLNIYHMARVFRDDPPSDHHNREFTMLEWYRTGADLMDLIDDSQKIFLVAHTIAVQEALVSDKVPAPHIEAITLDDLFRDLAHIDLPHVLTRIARGEPDHFQNFLTARNEHLPGDATFADAFFHVMLKYIEPNLPKDVPVAIFRWPVQLAALASACEDNDLYCDRFEIYFQGLEIANAYQECIDSDVLRSRFIAENSDRARLGKPCFPIDESLLSSVKTMKKTAGIALGFDRLLMATLRKSQIAEIIFGVSDRNF